MARIGPLTDQNVCEIPDEDEDEDEEATKAAVAATATAAAAPENEVSSRFMVFNQEYWG